ncbi:MAG: 4Fe-4S binding protein [Candidatus Adiutrix sp.]|jgi:iron only hydrogenase large subunit-like protein|nr:4Fe-4S binding protein [Candidatus Adiutrix sp.]
MAPVSPIHTVHSECQDCYKCLRHCPVQAIKVLNGQADVMPRRCLACGRCVSACPSGAKRVRYDLDKARELIADGGKVMASLAPSWRGTLSRNRPQLIAALKALGFAGVSETALGAQELSIRTAALLNHSGPGLHISSACPVIVDYVLAYRPDFAANIIPFASPALTHARLLKNEYGEDTSVVFIGPCFGKKNEADRHPDLIAAALTFGELKVWLEDVKEISVKDLSPDDEEALFQPGRANEGALYPLDGGMNESIRRVGVKNEVQLLNLDSLDLFIKALGELDPGAIVRPLFIEALACAGGCVAGPGIASERSVFLKMSAVLRHVVSRIEVPQSPKVTVPVTYEPAGLTAPEHTLEEIEAALHSLGKYTPEDQINCSGCGYPSCLDLARALLDGNAEPAMCVSHMRHLATRKAAAMIKSMPSAMVMVDGNLDIIEVNEAFLRMFTGGADSPYLGHPERLVGEPVESWLEFPELFRRVLKTGEDVYREHQPYNKRLYDLHIFNVERHKIIGAVVTDATILGRARERTAHRAREVISKNITIVQEIACLLGEHMVETETLLSAIAEDYGDDDGKA